MLDLVEAEKVWWWHYHLERCNNRADGGTASGRVVTLNVASSGVTAGCPVGRYRCQLGGVVEKVRATSGTQRTCFVVNVKRWYQPDRSRQNLTRAELRRLTMAEYFTVIRGRFLLPALVLSVGEVAAQSPCPSGTIVGAVLGTFFATLLVSGLTFWCLLVRCKVISFVPTTGETCLEGEIFLSTTDDTSIPATD